MKNTKTLFKIMLAAVTLFSLISSCSKDESKTTETTPKACFTTSNLIYNPLDLIKFQNCSQNYDRVEWDFGNGGSSVLSEPTFAYSKKGVYDVTLTVFKGSSSNKITTKVFVGTNPYISITANTTKWKNIPSNCNEVMCQYFLSTSDMSEDICQMNGGNSFSISDMNTPNSANVDGNIAITYNRVDYRVKLLVSSFYRDPNSGDVSFETRIDSFYSDIINVYTGPKTPDGNYKLSHVDITDHITMSYK